MELSISKQMTTRHILIDELMGRGMERKGNAQEIEIQKQIEGNSGTFSATVDFFTLLDSKDSVEVEWYSFWGSFFGEQGKLNKTIESAYGMILVKLGDSLYTISLGRGHFYANSFADMDFGFDVAEIIHDENTIDVKSAKFFQQSKSKSLTQYNRNSYVTTEIGESNELLISGVKIPDKYEEFLLHSYSGKMKFGSAVKIETREFKPKEIIELVYELHYIYSNEEKSGTLPRMNFVKNNEDNQPVIADLNKILLDSIIANDGKVALNYLLEDNGDVFLDPIREDGLEMVCNKSYALESYDIESVSNLIATINCDDISKVTIRPKSQKQNQIKLTKLLDCTVEYRKKQFCLFKGRWASFNQSYLDFIKKEIINVNKVAYYNQSYDLTVTSLEEGRLIQKSDKTKFDSGVTYNEYPFNIYLHKKFSYTLLDRKNEHEHFKSVEFADLYDNVEKALIHVKIGGTPDIRYCIKQSLHSAEIYNSQRNVLGEYGIKEVSKIVMLFVLNTSNLIQDDDSIDFLKNGSIYFQIEVIEWFKKIRSMGFNAEIIVASNRLEKSGKTTAFSSDD